MPCLCAHCSILKLALPLPSLPPLWWSLSVSRPQPPNHAARKIKATHLSMVSCGIWSFCLKTTKT